jgi:hypothetical protein
MPNLIKIGPALLKELFNAYRQKDGRAERNQQALSVAPKGPNVKKFTHKPQDESSALYFVLHAESKVQMSSLQSINYALSILGSSGVRHQESGTFSFHQRRTCHAD